MWHVETDFFALAVFLIMLLKEHSQRKRHDDPQRNAFYLVLIFSIINDIIDIASSLAMNFPINWWGYQILMTVYVIINVSYAVVYVWCDITIEEQRRKAL